MSRDRALDWIRKLRAKAASCAEIGSTAEAEAFEDKAQELMEKHGIRMIEVDPPKQRVQQVMVAWGFTSTSSTNASMTYTVFR